LVNTEKEGSPEEGVQQVPPRILIETSILTAFSGILFAFLLNIATRTPENFSLFDRYVLLIALYSSCIAISSFITPIISIKLRLERYVKRMENAMRVGSFAAIITVFLSLGLALSGLIIKDIAYAFAALPFIIIIGLVVLRK
jgi:hypothetical protein